MRLRYTLQYATGTSRVASRLVPLLSLSLVPICSCVVASSLTSVLAAAASSRKHLIGGCVANPNPNCRKSRFSFWTDGGAASTSSWLYPKFDFLEQRRPPFDRNRRSIIYVYRSRGYVSFVIVVQCRYTYLPTYLPARVPTTPLYSSDITIRFHINCCYIGVQAGPYYSSIVRARARIIWPSPKMELIARFVFSFTVYAGWIAAPIHAALSYLSNKWLPPPKQADILNVSASELADRIRKRQVKAAQPKPSCRIGSRRLASSDIIQLYTYT